MLPGERLRRLLSWCRLAVDCREWNHDNAEQCRQLLPQIAHSAMAVSTLPPMFQVPLSRFLAGDPGMREVIEDDDRLLLMLSDLRDYLSLLQRGYL